MHHFNEYPTVGFEHDIHADHAPRSVSDEDRARERFVNSGPDAVSDIEMLELILSRADSRAPIRPLVRRLLGLFGDFNRVVTASPARLKTVLGVCDSVVCELKLVEAAAQRLTQSTVLHREVLSCWQSLLDYCHSRMAHLDTEQFRVLYLDRKNILIADEVSQTGTVDHVPVYPREIIKRALEVNASALILVHNHPSGDPTPSPEDIAMTDSIQLAADTMAITLHDHLVIGSTGNYSFRSHGLL